MKYIKLILVPLTILFLTSCGKDFSEEILGIWKIESVIISDCPDEGITGGMITADENGCISLFGELGCQTLEFSENNTGSYTNMIDGFDNETAVFTYLLNEEESIVSICVDGECNPLTLVNDKLEIEYKEDGCPIKMTFTQ